LIICKIKLYFEPLVFLENIFTRFILHENPLGVLFVPARLVKTALKIGRRKSWRQYGIKIIENKGFEALDLAEDRGRFSYVIEWTLEVPYPVFWYDSHTE